MTYQDDLIRIIDQRVAVYASRTHAVGTIVERDTDGNFAQVTFDGSTVPVPCKVFANVRVDEGDRVGLVRLGSEWAVFGCYTQRTPGFAQYQNFVSGSATQATNTMADLPDSPQMTFVKTRDASVIDLFASSTFFATVTSAEVLLGIRVTNSLGVGVDFTVAGLYFNILNQHLTATGAGQVVGYPAGTYTLSLRWRRPTGTGTLNQNSDDWQFMTAREVL